MLYKISVVKYNKTGLLPRKPCRNKNARSRLNAGFLWYLKEPSPKKSLFTCRSRASSTVFFVQYNSVLSNLEGLNTMYKNKRITLKTKILGLISLLILLIVTLLASVFAYLQAIEDAVADVTWGPICVAHNLLKKAARDQQQSPSGLKRAT